MYLKSIEVQGFKSFANKLCFSFHNGVTCIVGPNGSGKSNVADAVRWVLGEQSAKQLRGSSMQDVIFSGTENRKPQSSAYVAITLDNSDHVLNIEYEEVTVARRVYRSGESEYLINGNVCRLRQVQELFYDTGIGKEGYSIIGQGQIDKILSSKPEDRRELFDEAAGIVKFKRRKMTALKKLESEHQNLTRVNDILSELEKQVGPLAKQAETARTYLNLREELKRADIDLFVMDYADARKQLAATEERIRIVTDELEETTGAAEDLRTRYSELENYFNELNTLLESARKQHSEAEVACKRMEGQINVLTEQIRAEHDREKTITGRVETIGEEIGQREDELTSLRKEQESLNAQLVKKKQEWQEASRILAQMDVKIQEASDSIDSAKGRMMELLNEKASASAQSERFETILEQNALRKQELLTRMEQLEQGSSQAQEQLDACIAEQKEIQERVSALDEQERGLQQHLQDCEKQFREASEQASQAQQAYHASHTRAESLQNLAERYEGYGNSVRRIMEHKQQYPGVRGVVADLIHTEKKYETAIETALGGSIQNVVTDTEQIAKALVAFLKKNQYGRATFLPLNGISGDRELSQKNVLREPGVFGVASDLVSYDPEYQKLVCQLLGRVVVADHIDHALALARKYQHSLRIVTLEGELLNPGGSITGGAFRNTSNLLGRRREIEDLEQAAQKSQKDYQAAQARMTQIRQDQEYSAGQLDGIRRTRQQEAIRYNTSSLQRKQAEEQLQQQDHTKEGCARELQQLEEQEAQLTERNRSMMDQIRTIDAENASSKDTVESGAEALVRLREEREAQAQTVQTLQVAYTGMEHQDGFQKENEARICQEIAHLQQESSELGSGVETIGTEVAKKEAEIIQLREQIRPSEEEMQQVQKTLEQTTAERDQTAAEQKQFFQRREELTEKESRLDKEKFRLESQKEQRENYIENRVNYLWNEYELMPSEVTENGNQTGMAASELKQYVTTHKNQIRALGPVNVNAMEEYKDVLERYTFLKGQHDDLVASEDALIRIVDELDVGMRKQFREQFDLIQKEFNVVFQELFGGGKGTLELTEDEDIIEAGIRIIAQPPGKKLQNMMQLSGGEKALTAISLLFAIQNLKPSPFCLLDEIEAALDDANVSRFAEYLKKLTEHTQFILISHRRGTMIAADRLYGITMQEKGVSALVSVNMIEQDLDQ